MSISAELAETLVATAGRAPSVHNTQPWRFQLNSGWLELWADPTRQLQVADPHGRELVISCGAALRTLRLAIRHLGLDPVVETVPVASKPWLLARVDTRPGPPPTRDEGRLFAAVHRRHTHRGRFEGGPASPSLLVALQETAEHEGAELFTVQSPGRSRRIADLVAAADRRQHGDPDSRAEVISWTPPPGSKRRDGVPTSAYPLITVGGPDDPPLRDFDLGRGWGHGDGPGVSDGALAVLVTDGDGLGDWLAAGQALQAVLLRAAVHWAFAAIYTQPLELPYVRALIRDELSTPAHAQMLLRLGYSDVATSTPRRPVREVVTS